jgi:small subunit ribosomal protein S17
MATAEKAPKAADAPKKKAAPAAAKVAPKAPSSTAALDSSHEAHGFRRKIVGKVIKNKMMKTVVVEAINSHRDALYGKYVRTRVRFKAHDETNQYNVGDHVEIQEHRPLSRDKRFIVVRLVKKFIEE